MYLHHQSIGSYMWVVRLWFHLWKLDLCVRFVSQSLVCLLLSMFTIEWHVCVYLRSVFNRKQSEVKCCYISRNQNWICRVCKCVIGFQNDIIRWEWKNWSEFMCQIINNWSVKLSFWQTFDSVKPVFIDLFERRFLGVCRCDARRND